MPSLCTSSLFEAGFGLRKEEGNEGLLGLLKSQRGQHAADQDGEAQGGSEWLKMHRLWVVDLQGEAVLSWCDLLLRREMTCMKMGGGE